MRVFHFKDRDSRVFLAVPMYGNPPAEFCYSLFCTGNYLKEKGVNVELCIVSGGCHVDDTRNQIIAAFLESGCDQMVFIDDDTKYNPEDLLTLINHNEDVVAGVCPKKTLPLDFAYRPLEGAEMRGDGLLEVEGVGGAFVKITRNAIDKLCEGAETYTQKISGVDTKIYQIFERTTEDGQRWGGDYTFCRKWTNTGGKIYVDPEMTFGHVGSFEWIGNLGHYNRSLNGETPGYIRKILEEIKTEKPTARQMISLIQSWGNNDWSSDANLLITLDMLAREAKGTILEFGSGVSTLVLAASGKKVESLESDEEWANKVLEVSQDTDLDVTIIDADIENDWYNVNIDASGVSLIYIDGPPRHIADRENVVNHMKGVEDGTIFVVDDVGEGVDRIAEEYNVQFKQFGRYAVGEVMTCQAC